jgi:hypothetical protein
MNKAVFIGFLTATLSVSAGAHAQALGSQTVATVSTSNSSFSVTAGELLAIGGGAVIGGAVLGFVLPISYAYTIGGLIGGYSGYLWYTGRN